MVTYYIIHFKGIFIAHCVQSLADGHEERNYFPITKSCTLCYMVVVKSYQILCT